jgi:hypothetical protein
MPCSFRTFAIANPMGPAPISANFSLTAPSGVALPVFVIALSHSRLFVAF